jgi:hypothetical protein
MSLLTTETVSVKRWGVGHRFDLTAEARAFLDGIMLGDGNYADCSSLSASLQFVQSVRHSDWLDYVEETCRAFGLDTRRAAPARGSVLLRSLAYRTLLPERNRWYIGRRKCLPPDLNLRSPVTLAQWYMGDGSLSVTGSGYLYARLHTNCFTEDEVAWLCELLKEQHSLRATIIRWHGQPIVEMSRKSAIPFLDIVRPHLVPSFAYKAPPDPWRPKRCEDCGAELADRKHRLCDVHRRARKTARHRAWVEANREHVREHDRRRRAKAVLA